MGRNLKLFRWTVLLVWALSLAFAQGSVSWIGGESGNWNDASNWSTGSTPQPSSDVVIAGSEGTTVWGNIGVFVGSISISEGNTLGFQNSFCFVPTTGITNQGTIRASSGSVVALSGTVFNTGGTIDAENGVADVEAVIIGGTLTSSGAGQIGLAGGGLRDVTNQAQVYISSNNNLFLSGSIGNSGRMTFGPGSSYRDTTTISVGSGTTYLTGGGEMEFASDSYYKVTGSGTLVNEDNTFTGGGYLTVTDGTGSFENHGTIQTADGRAFYLESGGGYFRNSGILRSGSQSVLGLSGTIDNVGGLIDARNGGVFVTGLVTGGTLTSSGTGQIMLSSGGLKDVTTQAVVHARDGANIAGRFSNSGALHIYSGVQLIGSVTFAGNGLVFFEGSGAQLTGSAINQGNKFAGSGKIMGDFHNAGCIAPGVDGAGSSFGEIDVTGDLFLSSESNVAFKLGGMSSSDVLTEGGLLRLQLDGTLSISLCDGIDLIQSSDTFALIISNDVIEGQFTNVMNGARLVTTDGSMSFVVNYGADSAYASNEVVLSKAELVPEPKTMGLLFVGVVGAFIFVRRSKINRELPQP